MINFIPDRITFSEKSPKFQSYLHYKNVNLPWLPEIPSHWNMLPGKACFTEKKIPNKGMVETKVLSLSYGHLVVKPEEKLHGLVPESFETYQIIEPGDIIFRTTDLQNDWNSLRFGISRHKGIITSAYMCLRSKPTLNDDYGHQLLHSYDLMKIFYGLGSGLRQNIDWRDIKYLPCIVPPLEEQNAIVRFLDYTDRRIKRYIRAKQKLIKLLEEEKQAIIHQAVTRGLNPNVPFKPSGFDWIGDIPNNWNVSRVKNEFLNLNNKRIPLSSSERGKMTLRLYDYYGASGIIDKVEDYIFDDELLLIAEDGANLVLRNLPLAIIARGKFWVNNHAHILKPIHGNILYLAHVMENINYQPWISGAAQPKLTLDRLMSIPIVVPILEEQNQLLAWINEKISPIIQQINKFKNEISLLQEYRTRLIADVVTGKLDMRAAAVELPEELDEEEKIDVEAFEPEEDDELEEALDP